MAIPLEWKASISGVEDVKAKLQTLNQEYRNGQIGVQEYSAKSRLLTGTLRNVNSGFNQQKQILLATHPALNALSRGMSIFSSVSHSALSIINALNISNLNQIQHSQALTDKQLELIEARKELANLIASGLSLDDPRVLLAKQKVESLTKSIEDLNKQYAAQQSQQFATNTIALATAIGTMGTAIINIIPWLKTFSVTSLAAFGPIALLAVLIATAFGLIVAALATVNPEFKSLNDSIIAIIPQWQLFSDAVSFLQATGEAHGAWLRDNFVPIFTTLIPTALVEAKTAFINFANGTIKLFEFMYNSVKNGFVFLINGIITGLNLLIKGFNKISPIKIGLIPHISVPDVKIPLIKAATGFEGIVNRPTMFLAGEAGSEAVSIRPNGGGGGTVIVHVHGSILAEREVERIGLNALKRDLKRVGSY